MGRPTLTAMMLVRNEQHRYLYSVMDVLRDMCDRVIVLDDASTDFTASICESYGCEVFHNQESMFADEWRARSKLWDLTVATNPQWILALDADEAFEPDGQGDIPGIVRTAENLQADTVSFPLYDLWGDEDHYRDDRLWNAHKRQWAVMMRYRPGVVYHWREQAHHCGRLPVNIGHRVLNSSLRLLHYGWMRSEDRRRKYERYMALDPDGRWGSLAQYQSILDERPHLSVLEG